MWLRKMAGGGRGLKLAARLQSELGKVFSDAPSGLPNWKHVAGCGWRMCYGTVKTGLRRARLLCRTRRFDPTWRWMKSLQKSVLTAAAASLPGFTQIGASVWQPTGVFELCDRATFWSNSPNHHKLGNTTGSLNSRLLPCPEISAVSRFPCSTCCSSAQYSESFRCTRKALFYLSFVCVHARTWRHRSESVGSHLIPQFPWIDS